MIDASNAIRCADDAAIAAAAEALREGDLVAFPTETVYGLGADATNERAVARIFEAKGRPHFNPLIVHVPGLAEAERIAVLDDRAHRLARRFWPGALTLVLPRRDDAGLSKLVSAGLDTVAVRVPAHPLAEKLLTAVGRPIAAPSANRSGAVSPTRAVHVAGSLPSPEAGGPAIILDSGPCAIGLESTVVDLSGADAALLRPGGIAVEEIEAEIGALAGGGDDDTAPKSPGMMSRHYAPATPLRLDAAAAGPGEALVGFGPTAPADAAANLSPTGDLLEAAANLFEILHRLDAEAHASIAVMPVPYEGLGLAINDRLERAARR